MAGAQVGARGRGVSRRAEITLTLAEQRELLERQRIVVVSSIGPRGWPHSMPLWYVLRDGEIWIYTYAKSQKVRNLERDPRATLLVETGHEYFELRGVEIEGEAEIHRDHDVVYELARELTLRYSDAGSIAGDAAEALRAQAKKRVAVRFEPRRVASWDHRKLGGRH
jgi:PPOX class probable F420-dependent enzyme